MKKESRFANIFKVGLTVLISVLIIFTVVKAGTITPPGGEPSAQFYTLSEIYTRLTTNGTATEGGHDFNFSDTLAGTGRTLTEIYNAIPTINPSKLLDDTTYLGITGNIATRTLSSTNTNVNAGYYATTTLDVVDADLVSGNIKSGVILFGINGSGNVVDTSSGDAVAADLFNSKIAWVDGSEITGTLNLACNTITFNGTGNLVANAYDGAGTGLNRWCVTDGDDIAASDVLSGKIAWINGATTTGSLANCSSEGQQSCYTTGSYYAGTSRTLSASSVNVPAGYYGAGNALDVVDADLTAANILSGKTIFGIDGSGGVDFSLQKRQIYDDWNCSANNAEASGSCIAGDPEYTGEEATWTLYTDATPPSGTLDSGKVYKDSRTGLYWSDKATSTKSNSFTVDCSDAAISGGTCDPNSYATKGDAISLCDALSLDANQDGTDETDWRLPTQKELMQAYIDGAANTLPSPNYNFWSSTEYYNDASYAWYVGLYRGYTYSYTKTSSYYVRCVRP